MSEINYDEYSRHCVTFMQQLIQTPSVNGEQNEKAIAGLVVKEAAKLGLVSRVIEAELDRPNVFVGGGFDSPDGLLLVAHTDTVPIGDESKWQHGPFSGNIVDGKLYGRGALDCKGGLAIGMYVLKILQDTGQGHMAKLLSGADEESGADSQFGIRAVLREGLKAKGAVYLYGGKLNNECIIGHRGLVRAWVACEGESVHSGSHDWQERTKGENAIMGIVKFLEELQSVTSDTTSEFFPQYRTVVTPTLIRGGEGESIVPDRSETLLDIRTLPGDNEKILNQVRQIAERLSQGKRRYTVSVKNNIPAVITDPESPLVQEMLALVKEQLNVVNPVLHGSGPANESYMLIEAGIPTITGFGPTGEGFHSPNEYAEVDSIKRSLEFLVRLSQNLAARKTE